MNITKIKQKWEKKGLICELYELPSQESWSDLGHRTDEYFILLEEGDIEVSCQGKVFNLDIGEEIMIPAKESHIVKNNGSKTSQLLWIHYPNY